MRYVEPTEVRFGGPFWTSSRIANWNILEPAPRRRAYDENFPSARVVKGISCLLRNPNLYYREEFCILECDAVSSGKSSPNFRHFRRVSKVSITQILDITVSTGH
jgi:hypothetical protein